MQVHIEEVISRVRSEVSQLLTPPVLRQLVAAVLEAVREAAGFERRARQDTRVSSDRGEGE